MCGITGELVSRVLYLAVAVIYLCLPLPTSSGISPLPPSSFRWAPPPCGALEGVASDRVYRKALLPRSSVSSYLAFPPLPTKGWRYISVALARRLPSADVIRYPCPVKPGLSSRYGLSAWYRATAPLTGVF